MYVSFTRLYLLNFFILAGAHGIAGEVLTSGGVEPFKDVVVEPRRLVQPVDMVKHAFGAVTWQKSGSAACMLHPGQGGSRKATLFNSAL